MNDEMWVWSRSHERISVGDLRETAFHVKPQGWTPPPQSVGMGRAHRDVGDCIQGMEGQLCLVDP